MCLSVTQTHATVRSLHTHIHALVLICANTYYCFVAAVAETSATLVDEFLGPTTTPSNPPPSARSTLVVGTDCCAHAVPVVHGSIANRILQRAQQRDTTASSVQETQARVGLAAVVQTGSLTEASEMSAKQRRSNSAYFAGEIQRRDSAVTRVLCSSTGLTDISDLTVELAIFPFLFAEGKGCFDGDITFSEYLKMRSMQLFSRFTLVREYLLVMVQVRCCNWSTDVWQAGTTAVMELSQLCTCHVLHVACVCSFPLSTFIFVVVTEWCCSVISHTYIMMAHDTSVDKGHVVSWHCLAGVYGAPNVGCCG